jgi:general L-amino acid transport system permease protein
MATVHTRVPGQAEPTRVPVWNNPRIRGVVTQVIVVLALALLIWWIVGNTTDNLRRQNISSGFGFLDARSGFDIPQTLIPYSSNSLYRQAFLVGIINTLLVAISGIITASVIGFLLGVGRLSGNWLIRQICLTYVEVFRNIPPLLVIFFLYLAVLQVLPSPRDSIELGIPLGFDTPFGRFGLDSFIGFDAWLNSRGFFIPRLIPGEGIGLVVGGIVLGLVLAVLVYRWARKRQMATGQQFPVFRTALLLIVGLSVLAYFVAGQPLTVEWPIKGTFNLSGGWQIRPEFLALYLALSLYTASFIAEIVRAGIIGVSRGQSEAAYAVGLRPGQTLRLVIVPQAMRIIIPPLTSQYLNLTKNSSLAVAVGYPDLVQIGQTAMNQSGQAIEVVVIWMAVYLTISLATSLFMNWFNNRTSLVER